jgi:hypothetical protein
MFKKNKAKLRDKEAFAIKKDSTVENSADEKAILTYQDMTMSMLFLGASGSGKTSAGTYPLLNNFIKDGLSGIVLDVKGDYTPFLLEECPERLFLIGGSEKCTPCSITAGMSRESFRDLIAELVNGGSDLKDYWGTGGIKSALLIYDFHMEAYKSCPTLKKLFDWISNPAEFILPLANYLKNTSGISQELEASLKSNSTEFSILRKGAFDYFINGSKSDNDDPLMFLAPSQHEDAIFGTLSGSTKVNEQYTWHHDKVMGKLEIFGSDPNLVKNLSSEECINIGDLIYKEKKIIAVDMPTTFYGNAGETICRYIRERFYEAVFSYDMEFRTEQNYGKDNFTFMLIDEYQNYKNLKPEGRYNDNKFVDKSRSFGHINVFSTQGIDSLLSDSDTSTVYSFLQNVRNLICLSTNGIATQRYLSEIEKGHNFHELSHPEKMGVCYYNFPKNSAKNNGCDYGIGELGTYYNNFLNKEYSTSSFSDYISKPVAVSNPFFRVSFRQQNIDRIVILTHKNGAVKDDFMASYKSRLRRLCNDNQFSKNDLKIDPPFVKYFSANPSNKSMKSTLKKVIRDDCVNSTFIIIRGGGSEEDFEFYNDQESIDVIKNAIESKNIGNFYSALGHFKNKTSMDKLSLLESHTPSDLGTQFADIHFNQIVNGLNDVIVEDEKYNDMANEYITSNPPLHLTKDDYFSETCKMSHLFLSSKYSKIRGADLIFLNKDILTEIGVSSNSLEIKDMAYKALIQRINIDKTIKDKRTSIDSFICDFVNKFVNEFSSCEHIHIHRNI